MVYGKALEPNENERKLHQRRGQKRLPNCSRERFLSLACTACERPPTARILVVAPAWG